MAAVKKMMPAYITETNRRLFESDDNARIVHEESSACVSETSVIAGTRKRFWERNAVLPEKATWSSSSRMAGRKVTPSRHASTGASRPMMYSVRVSGFDK